MKRPCLAAPAAMPGLTARKFLEPVSKASTDPVAMYSSLRRKPEPRCRPLVDAQKTLDSGLHRNDVQGLCYARISLNTGS